MRKRILSHHQNSASLDISSQDFYLYLLFIYFLHITHYIYSIRSGITQRTSGTRRLPLTFHILNIPVGHSELIQLISQPTRVFRPCRCVKPDFPHNSDCPGLRRHNIRAAYPAGCREGSFQIPHTGVCARRHFFFFFF